MTTPPHLGIETSMLTLILAGADHGLTRAWRDAPEDAWTVETDLADLTVLCAASAAGGRYLYAGTAADGVWRSVNGGGTWAHAGLSGSAVWSLAIDPSNPHVVYAGAGPVALHVSRDRGASWEELPALRARRKWFWLAPGELMGTARVRAIAVCPTQPTTVVTGIEAGAVLASTDGGESFSGHRSGALRSCHALCYHAANGWYAYEAGTGGGAISSDGGVTWYNLRNGLDRRFGWSVAADGVDPECWYLAAAPGAGPVRGGSGPARCVIFRSTDRYWHPLELPCSTPRSGGELEHMCIALATLPGVAGALYAVLANGEVWHSDNHGDSWRPERVGLPAVRRFAVVT